MKPKYFQLFFSAVLAGSLALTGCSSNGGDSDKEITKIGVAKLLSHPSLDASEQGFIDALADAGYVEGENLELDRQNAQNDQSTLANIAQSFANSDYQAFFAISTPVAQSIAAQVTDRPIIFAAVTDPQEAGVVDSWEHPGGNVTGVSDMNPMEGQVDLIKEILPDIKTLGIVYSSGEVNSAVQVDEAKKAAEKYGIEVKESTITNSSEVAQAAESLDVDAFLIPTDNVVVSAAESMVQVANTKQIPVFGSDEPTVERGAVAGVSIDYYQQGKDAAEVMIKALTGTNPADIPVEAQKEFNLYVNKQAASEQGIEIPQSVLDRAEIVGE